MSKEKLQQCLKEIKHLHARLDRSETAFSMAAHFCPNPDGKSQLKDIARQFLLAESLIGSISTLLQSILDEFGEDLLQDAESPGK